MSGTSREIAPRSPQIASRSRPSRTRSPRDRTDVARRSIPGDLICAAFSQHITITLTSPKCMARRARSRRDRLRSPQDRAQVARDRHEIAPTSRGDPSLGTLFVLRFRSKYGFRKLHNPPRNASRGGAMLERRRPPPQQVAQDHAGIAASRAEIAEIAPSSRPDRVRSRGDREEIAPRSP